MMANSMKNGKADIKFCSINIDGMSEKSRFVLDKYTDDQRFDIVVVQESRNSDNEKISLTNMEAITDDNNAKNSGSIIYVRNTHSITKLKEINKISTNIDTSWGIAVIHNKRFIIGSVYLKHHYINGVEEFITMLKKASELKSKLKATGIIVMGDFNARHTLWGDKISDSYGKKLIDKLDPSEFSICAAGSPTFLACNGSSHIDLMIISNNILDKAEKCKTDEDIELYSGAPNRGHVPLIATLQIENNLKKKAVEKLCTDKISWEDWSKDLDEKLKEYKATQERLIDPELLGNFLDSTIQSVTLKHATKKISSHHSKPYWTKELTRLCEIMRAARRKYCKRNTDKNKENLYDSKLEFDNTRKQECQDFLIKKTSKLNSVQALRFWKEFNLIFKKKTPQKIDPLFNEKGDFLTDESDIEEVMFATFFEGHHLQQGNFDDHFYSETNKIYNNIIHQNPTENTDNENTEDLNAEITVQEIKTAIKSYHSVGKSSDKEHFNPEMFRHLPPHAIECICKLANLCLKEGKWIWNKAEVIFLK